MRSWHDARSISSTATSIDATQRKLIVGIVIATLLTLAIVIADLASGGRPDPPALRAAATLLDGAWRFHTGDDPRWADANTDDSGWETIDMTAVPGSHDGDVGLPDYVGGWMAHGHPGYHGYAWYRRAVTVPAGHASWDILGPTLVEDGYELYWNGQRLGGSGRLGPAPRVVGTRPLRFALPADAAGTRGVLAVRAYMLPGSGASADGGGMHSAPILAPRPISDALHRVQWQRTIAGYIVDAIEPLAMFALIGLVLGCRSRSSHKGFLIFASIALALMAGQAPQQCDRRLDRSAGSGYLCVAGDSDVGASGGRLDVGLEPLVPASVAKHRCVGCRAGGRRDHRRRDPFGGCDQRQPARVDRAVCRDRRAHRRAADPCGSWRSSRWPRSWPRLFGGELLDPIGVPGIWFPFGIGVSRTQYIYAIAIPLLAFLIVRTLHSKSTSMPRALS